MHERGCHKCLKITQSVSFQTQLRKCWSLANLRSRQNNFPLDKHVWSSNLRCYQEDLNLSEWPFLDTCKSIWKDADKKIRKQRRAKNSLKKSPYGKEAKGKSIKVKSSVEVKVLKRPSRRKKKVFRDAATSPILLPVSDHAMSLEPISSSSFHSSDDGV